jgi:hypothetical protein
MKPHLLIALLILALIGLIACGVPESETPGVDTQPTLPAGDVPQQSGNNPSPETAASFDCAGSERHPIGQGIAETYEVPYDQVMTWFCGGYGFENILIALETSEAVDVPADALLQMLLEKEWEEIWVEVGFTDRP